MNRGIRETVTNYKPLGSSVSEKRTIGGFYVSLLLLLALSTLPVSQGRSHIHVSEKGTYENIIISIEKEVPHDNCTLLMRIIKEIMTRASDYLYESSGGKVSLGNVFLLIPFHWKGWTCSPTIWWQVPTTRIQLRKTTLQVRAQNTVFGNKFWTEQQLKCGRPADKIFANYQYFLSLNTTIQRIYGRNGNKGHIGNRILSNATASFLTGMETAAKAFLKEWTKFRYDAYGKENENFSDPLYALRPSGSGSENGTCIKPKENTVWKNNCMLVSNGNVEKENATLGSLHQEPLVKVVCPNASNGANLNGKTQRLPCYEKPVAQIMRNHADFNRTGVLRPLAMVPEPGLTVLKVSHPRFVMLWVGSSFLSSSEYQLLLLAAQNFIQGDLPYASSVGLASVDASGGHIVSNMTEMGSRKLRNELAEKIPKCLDSKSDINSSFHLLPGVVAAIDVLRHNNQPTSNGVVILVTPSLILAKDLEDCVHMLKENNVTLTLMEFPFSTGIGNVTSLSDENHGWGPHFPILPPDFHPESYLQAQISLVNAFQTITRVYNEDTDRPYPSIIHQAEYATIGLAKGSFSYEHTNTSSFLEISIFLTNLNDNNLNDIVLTSPTGETFSVNSWHPDLKGVGVIKVRPKIKQSGVWQYELKSGENNENSSSPCIVQITKQTFSEHFEIELFTSAENSQAADLTTFPLALYVKVWHQGNPVLEADVQATILIGGQKYTIQLMDMGSGEPDLIKGDGIYSRYFIPPKGVSHKIWHISAKVSLHPKKSKLVQPLNGFFLPDQKQGSSEECCGSLIESPDSDLHITPAPYYETFIPPILVQVSNITTPDAYKPGRISDLRVNEIDDDKLRVKLQWTAPGATFDYGRVSAYRVLYLPEGIRKHWAPLKTIRDSKEAGVEENATLRMPYEGIFQICVEAMAKGRVGKRSSVVRFGIDLASRNRRRKSTSVIKGTVASLWDWDSVRTILFQTFLGLVFTGFVLTCLVLVFRGPSKPAGDEILLPPWRRDSILTDDGGSVHQSCGPDNPENDFHSSGPHGEEKLQKSRSHAEFGSAQLSPGHPDYANIYLLRVHPAFGSLHQSSGHLDDANVSCLLDTEPMNQLSCSEESGPVYDVPRSSRFGYAHHLPELTSIPELEEEHELTQPPEFECINHVQCPPEFQDAHQIPCPPEFDDAIQITGPPEFEDAIQIPCPPEFEDDHPISCSVPSEFEDANQFYCSPVFPDVHPLWSPMEFENLALHPVTSQRPPRPPGSGYPHLSTFRPEFGPTHESPGHSQFRDARQSPAPSGVREKTQPVNPAKISSDQQSLYYSNLLKQLEAGTLSFDGWDADWVWGEGPDSV